MPRTVLLWANLFGLFSAILLTGCSTSLVKLGGVGQSLRELGVSSTPSSSNYPDDDAVIVSSIHEIEMSVHSESRWVTEERVHEMKKIFRHVEDHSSIEIPLYAGQKLREISARTITADGRIVELKPGDFHVQAGVRSRGVFHSDRKVVRFTFPALEENCLIEYKYRIRKRFPMVFDTWAVQRSLPVIRNEYRLTVPDWLISEAGVNWKYRKYRCINIGEPTMSRPNYIGAKDQMQYSWVTENIPPLRSEPMMPPWLQEVQYIQFAPSDWDDWNDVSSWYYLNFLAPQLGDAPEVAAAAKSLVRYATSEEEKIDVLRQYVQQIRYVAIELGSGGLVPTLPEEVLERKYGDCKDKAVLLVEMLHCVGVSARPVLIRTSSQGKTDPEFPSWGFDHMIVVADTEDREYWVDATAPFYPLGCLPSACSGIPALVLNPDGTGEIVETPAARYQDNSSQWAIRLELGDVLSRIHVKATLKGEVAAWMRGSLGELTSDELSSYCMDLVSGSFESPTIVGSRIRGLEDWDGDFNLSFEFDVDDAVRSQGDLHFLTSIPLELPVGLRTLPAGRRTLPVDWGVWFDFSRELTVDLSNSNLRPRSIPQSVQILDDSISYKSGVRQDDSYSFTTWQNLSIKKRETPASRYDIVRSILKEVDTGESQTIVLVANP